VWFKKPGLKRVAKTLGKHKGETNLCKGPVKGPFKGGKIFRGPKFKIGGRPK